MYNKLRAKRRRHVLRWMASRALAAADRPKRKREMAIDNTEYINKNPQAPPRSIDEDDEEGDFDPPPPRATRTSMQDGDDEEGDFDPPPPRPTRVSMQDSDDEEGDFDLPPPRPTRASMQDEDDSFATGSLPNSGMWQQMLAGDDLPEEDSDESEDEDYEEEFEEDDELSRLLRYEEKVIAAYGTSVPPGFEAPTQPYEDYDDGLTEEEARIDIASMCVDKDGRIMLEGGMSAQLDYDFLSFEDTVSGDMASLREDCEKLAVADKEASESYSSGSTYWVPGDADRSSLSALEAVALDIFDFHAQKHFEECPGLPRVPLSRCGAEWWTLAMDCDEGEVGWHWDRDYAVEDTGVNIPPHLATVTYLNDVGAPTIVLPIATGADGFENFSTSTDTAFLSLPRPGKHISFDGRFLHAAVDELLMLEDDDEDDYGPLKLPINKKTSSKRRVTLLVNIWLDWQPRDCSVLPEKVRAKLAPSHLASFKPALQNDGDLVSQIALVQVSNKVRLNKPKVWPFKVRKFKAKVAIALPDTDLSESSESSFLFQSKTRKDKPPKPIAVVKARSRDS